MVPKTGLFRLFSQKRVGTELFDAILLSERIRSGIAAAKAKGKTFGWKLGQRPKSDRLTPKVMHLQAEGRSYSFIAKELNLCKTTVMQIGHRHRGATNADQFWAYKIVYI